MNKKIFFDMDGVLTEYRIYCGQHEMQQEGYFDTLKPEWNMVLAFINLATVYPNNVFILTKVYPTIYPYSVEEKKNWVRKILPDFDCQNMIMVNGEKEEKSEAIKNFFGFQIDQDCFLIDDYNPNLYDWRMKGGRAIKYVNGVNDKKGSFNGHRILFTDTPDAIYDKILKIITEE